jgi:hypothetical protein
MPQHLGLTLAAYISCVCPADSFWVLEEEDGDGSKYVQITLAKAAMGYESWQALLVADLPDTSVTHRVRALNL